MKKILITYALAGDGHKKAAEALYESFLNSHNTQTKAVLADVLDYASPFFRFTYKKTYEVLIRYAPWLWGFFYNLLNNRFFYLIAKPFRRFLNSINSRRFTEFIINEKFDLVLSTHFFPPEVISGLKKKGISGVKLVTVVTDFKAHRYWIAKYTDMYVVASNAVKEDFISMGVLPDKIKVLGIPIAIKFNSLLSRARAREEAGMENKFTVLLMGGGMGVGPIKKILLNLQKIDFDFQVITVCGRNKALEDKLRAMCGVFDKKTKIYGFTENIDILMSASDIMISKTGGATVSESLACGIPIIVLRPIPGQETANARFLYDSGIGFKIRGLKGINNIIEEFFNKKNHSANLTARIKELSTPQAADDIFKLALEIIL
jgi:processive 1,2-diacylglycerol beta-glucosyltransferase